MWRISPRPGVAQRARPVSVYAAVLAATIAAGLSSRRFPAHLPEFVVQYAGDTLWAAMVYWLLALTWRRAGIIPLAAGSMTIATAVEVSQRYRAPWIDSLRSTTIGRLVLGSDFVWSDLACYATGVGIAVALDVWIVHRAERLVVRPR